MFRPNFLSHLLCLCFALGNSPSWAIETSISISPPSPTEFTATDHYFRPFVFPYVLNQISTTTSSSSPSAPPALIHVKLKIYDPIVQRQLLEKIRSCATLSPAQAQSVQDTVFAFLYGEMMGLQKAVPHWNDDRIFKTFSSLLHRLSPSSSFIINTEHPEFDLSHSTQTLEGFWHDYLGQEAHKPFIRFLARISKLDRENQKRLLTEFFHPAEQKRKPRNLPLTWQVYWDHYASQNFAGLYRYLSSQIVAHQPHLLDVGAYKIEFNGDGQVVAAIKNLLQEEEFQEFVRQLDLILRNDTEQIMRQYEINIFKEEYAQNPAKHLAALIKFKEEVLNGDMPNLPLALQRLKSNTALRNWHLDQHSGLAFIKTVRFTLDKIITQEKIGPMWAKLDPVIEDFTYGPTKLVLIRHFKTTIKQQPLEFYLQASSGQTIIHLARYGQYNNLGHNFFCLTIPQEIWQKTEHFALNIKDRLRDGSLTSPLFLHDPQDLYPQQDTYTTQDAQEIGYRLKRLIFSKIFQTGEAGNGLRFETAEHVLEHFNPHAYRMAPYRIEANFSIAGIRFIGISYGTYKNIVATFSTHDAYTTWLRHSRNLINRRNANDITRYYDLFLRPALDAHNQQFDQIRYQEYAKSFQRGIPLQALEIQQEIENLLKFNELPSVGHRCNRLLTAP